ncbi:MAG: hypothetical protein HY260_05445 [Chloroflexi bacterium]|nr:hypothetical protein [Chloroflexota bacterium]
MAGSAALLIVGPFVGLTAEAARPLVWTFGLSLLVNLLITWGGEFAVPHASQVAAMAAHMITGGKYSRWYRASLIGGLVVPLVIVALPDPSVFAYSLAGLLSLAGLFAYEWVFVMAPQDVPNN